MKSRLSVRSNRTRNRGITLIELIVAFSITLLILALVLPAVLAAREGQRQMSCKARLSNLGRAITTHESVRGYFPSAVEADPGLNMTALHLAPHFHLLPYLDHAALALQADLTNRNDALTWPDHLTLPSYVLNGEIKKARVVDFLCPSDGYSTGIAPGNNYRVCIGPNPDPMAMPAATINQFGVFSVLTHTRAADIRDGLSTTIAMSERNRGNGDPHLFDARRDSWLSGWTSLHRWIPSADELVPVCRGIISTSSKQLVYPYSGYFWYFSGYECTWYNHALPPNSPDPDCSTATWPQQGTPSFADLPAITTARSNHSNGVNCVYVDGHVQFISNNMELRVWRAISTRSAGELLSSNDY